MKFFQRVFNITLGLELNSRYNYEFPDRSVNVNQESEIFSVYSKKKSFKYFNSSKIKQITQRKVSNNLGLVLKDTQSSGNQRNWILTATVTNLLGVAAYLVYRDAKGGDKYLTDAAVPKHTQDKVQSGYDPLEVEVSDKWWNDTEIL